MIDLFGVDHPDPSPSELYRRRMQSSSWRRLREEKIRAAGRRCERCGVSGYAVRLEVHHTTYDRLGRERLEDLQVLCPACHTRADVERAERSEVKRRRRRRKSPLYAGFANWMRRKYPPDWPTWISPGVAQAEKRAFLWWIRAHYGGSYALNLSMFGVADEAPEWTP